MDSPLHVLRNYVGTTVMSAVSNVLTDERQFEFHFPFPVGQGYTFKDSVMLRCAVSWDPVEKGIYLETSLKPVDDTLWKDADIFFSSLAGAVRMFLVSTIVVNEGEPDEDFMADGVLYLLPDKKMQGLSKPVFGVSIPCEDEADVKYLHEAFDIHLQCSCNTLWLANAVLRAVEDQGHEIGPYERLRILTRTHSEMVVVRPEENRTKDSPPPKMHFPKGLYGGKIQSLRPQ
jgi:hypothetical protein